MKHTLVSALFAALLSTTYADYRALTDVQGRIIEAELVMYDARNNSVVVKRKGSRSSKTVPLTVFCEKDQAYIKKWSSSQDFLSNRKFEVNIKRIKKKSGEDGQTSYSSMARKYYDHSFNIVLNNKSTTDFSDMKIDYVIHYTQEHHIKRNLEKEERKGVLIGGGTIASIPMRSEKEIMTDPVTLQSRYTPNLPRK